MGAKVQSSVRIERVCECDQDRKPCGLLQQGERTAISIVSYYNGPSTYCTSECVRYLPFKCKGKQPKGHHTLHVGDLLQQQSCFVHDGLKSCSYPFQQRIHVCIQNRGLGLCVQWVEHQPNKLEIMALFENFSFYSLPPLSLSLS